MPLVSSSAEVRRPGPARHRRCRSSGITGPRPAGGPPPPTSRAWTRRCLTTWTPSSPTTTPRCAVCWWCAMATWWSSATGRASRPATATTSAREGLDQTVGELLADHLPANADPRLRQVTVEQLLTMTSGLAGDDASLGGDDRLFDRILESRDWVRHILGRRLETTPGESWAYSGDRGRCHRPVLPGLRQGKALWALGIAADDALELTVRHWPVSPAEWESTSGRRWPGPGARPGCAPPGRGS
jgi:Beta-lactamase